MEGLVTINLLCRIPERERDSKTLSEYDSVNDEKLNNNNKGIIS